MNYTRCIELSGLPQKGFIRGLPLALVLLAGPASASETKVFIIKAEKVGMSSDRMERMTALGERYVNNNQAAGMVNLVMRTAKSFITKRTVPGVPMMIDPCKKMICLEFIP